MLDFAVENYIKTAKGLPFFYITGDDDYLQVQTELVQHGLKTVRMSDFCRKDDKFPDIDELVDYFRTADVDYRDNKFVVVGLGEYLALRGADEASKELQRLKTTTLGNARVVLLLRGVTLQANAMLANDARLTAQGRAYSCANCLSSITVTNVLQDIGAVQQKGIKWLLRDFEDGACGNCLFTSALSYDNAAISVSIISSAYAAICYKMKGFSLPQSLGSDGQWSQFLTAVKKANDSVDKLFEKYGVADDFETDIYEKISGEEFKNWLFFIATKLHPDRIQNSYLAYAVNSTNSFSDLKKNVLAAITTISHTDRRFMKLYNERKKLLRGFPESDIAIFVKENEIDPTEEIYRYTDNTPMERKKVISWVSRNSWDDSLSYVYPALALYLKRYIFDCGSLSDVLTAYFEKYKAQKVNNQLDTDFLSLVDEYGQSGIFTKLETRDNMIKSLEDKKNAFLYWIDALGVEYLSYFVELARKKGLSIHIDVARSDLPTITTINKAFYDQWTGIGKYKEEALDDIKHHDKGGFFFTACEEPIHLASELSVIEKAVEQAATELAMHHCKSFVIASDHGASRLAVIRKKEEKYQTDTKGEHSGRCCKTFEGCDLTYKVEENGYIVLTDYGRFKGSREANVEVHGGATLEEIVVPIITLRLKKQGDADIRVLNAASLEADRKNGTAVSLYVSDVENTNLLCMVINGTKYPAESLDSTNYSIMLTDIKRQKKCIAEIYDGDDLIGSVELNIKGKSASVNKGFDAEFDDFDL